MKKEEQREIDLIGHRLRRLRQYYNMDQGEFADRLQVHRNYVSAWEQGRRFISGKYLVKIHLVFNISLSFFDIKEDCMKELTWTVNETPINQE